uniref:Uncharacterized protein n=1 Tax=Oryza punctata TaxID=4537 RepID=A0A0E0JHY5_ORYPU
MASAAGRKAARDREEVLDLASGQTAAAGQGSAWEEALNLAGDRWWRQSAKVEWQGCRVTLDRVEVLDLASGGGG